MKTIGLVLLGGKGLRLNNELPKQFIEVNGKMICEYSLEVFSKSEQIDEICISCLDGYDEIYENLLKKYPKIKHKAVGGSERQHSIYNALKIFEKSNVDVIVIHDGARPLITNNEIVDVIKFAKEYGATTVALPVSDTIKMAENNFVKKTIDRSNLFSVKTPQAFSYDLILEAHNAAINDKFLGTDDCSLIERMGKTVYIAKASEHNIKITTNIDLIIMKSILAGDK